MSVCNEDGTTSFAIISGVLLLVSELLPYLKSTDGNGLVHGMIKVLQKFAKASKQVELNNATDLPV